MFGVFVQDNAVEASNHIGCARHRPTFSVVAVAVAAFIIGTLSGGLLFGQVMNSSGANESNDVYCSTNHPNTDDDTNSSIEFHLPPYGTMALEYGDCPLNKSLTSLLEILAKSLPKLPPKEWMATRLWNGSEEAYEAMLVRLEAQIQERFLSYSSYSHALLSLSSSGEIPGALDFDKRGRWWKSSDTLSELEIMKQMRPTRQTNVVYMPNGLTGNGMAWPNVSHLELFSQEDTSPGTIMTVLESVAIGGGWHDKYSDAVTTCGHLALRFKDRFQRPRPYQSSRLLSSNIQPHLAKSAQTASFPSGHALQTYCTVAAILDNVAISIPPEGLSAIMRLSHDVGDRRVLSGVHYPSDNYASATIFNELMVSGAWPVAHALGIRFGRTSEERARLCNGAEFPLMCDEPSSNPGESFRI